MLPWPVASPGKSRAKLHRFLPKPPSNRSYQTTGRRGPRVMPSSRVGVLSSCRAVAARYGRASACAATSRRSWQGLDGVRVGRQAVNARRAARPSAQPSRRDLIEGRLAEQARSPRTLAAVKTAEAHSPGTSGCKTLASLLHDLSLRPVAPTARRPRGARVRAGVKFRVQTVLQTLCQPASCQTPGQPKYRPKHRGVSPCSQKLGKGCRRTS